MKTPTPEQARHNRRGGFTLIEIVAVLAGLSVLLVISCVILVGIFRLHESSAASHQNLSRHEVFADQFRDDVAHAESAPASLDKFQAGPNCLILSVHGSSPIVYFEEGGEWKRRSGPKNEIVNLHPGPEGTRLEFSRSGPANRVVTVHISRPHSPSAMHRNPLEISAALGGDMR